MIVFQQNSSRQVLSESDVRAYIRLGIISGGARLGADDKIELASLEYESNTGREKKRAGEKRNKVLKSLGVSIGNSGRLID